MGSFFVSIGLRSIAESRDCRPNDRIERTCINFAKRLVVLNYYVRLVIVTLIFVQNEPFMFISS